MARRDDFEGRLEQNKEILNREENKHIRDQGPKNADMMLVPVQYHNHDRCMIHITPDVRYKNYILQWQGVAGLIPSIGITLQPGRCVTLPNDYVVLTGIGRPKGEPVKVIKSYGKAKRR